MTVYEKKVCRIGFLEHYTYLSNIINFINQWSLFYISKSIMFDLIFITTS